MTTMRKPGHRRTSVLRTAGREPFGAAGQAHSGGLVFSTESGRMCPACRRPVASCACSARGAAVGDGKVRVARESKGRGGKTVTVVRCLPLEPVALEALGKRLRSAMGAGGTAKDGVLEVQGDHVERIVAWLEAEGWKAKRAGG